MTDKEIFKSVVKGANVFTSEVVGYFRIGKYVCELAHGDSYFGRYPFGVAVVNAETMEKEDDLSYLFFERELYRGIDKAIEYIKELKSK